MRFSRNSREISGGMLAIAFITASKHTAQIKLFDRNSFAEEPPRDIGKDGRTKEVGKQNLGAYSPDEPAQIAGVSANRVDSMGDELMRGATLLFDEVGEGRFSGQPCGFAKQLTNEE
ncbi:hypothetical protein BWQ96_01398 [Gracilariopsis chorda]|uniref:Uncharacterized protein n=1 Tax=Gracilariopsis chorda TaxID=448386 RepID=A0A2V3J3Z0_9FLOR|nr:hypothetical protein BWQ96_01398 [Gracilariopsis chorda]|eukprot:PXF48842.1 hypothetical protein BWQ96_01398 [Gracilariopsis chorda]